MRLLLLADIAALHWEHGSEQVDALLSCGDVDEQVILDSAQAHGCSLIFAVKGNHDTAGPFVPPIIDLHLQVWKHDGLSFGGMNGSWRYKPRGHFLYDQAEAQGLLAGFPPVQVFLSHNSPRGIHDRNDLTHHGFEGLTAYITRAKPRVVIHGHQHLNRETWVGETRVIGVCGQRVFEI